MNTLTIEAGKNRGQYWRDLWRYRELLYFLAWRDILVRYKQTVIGVTWAVIRPVLTMIVLTIVFGEFAGMASGGVPYPLMVLCGMLPWQFFANAFAESGNSLVSNQGMITKVYFPRLVVPISSVVTSFVDFMISAVLLASLLVYYRHLPDFRIFTLPFFVTLAFGTAFGAGVWVSALMVRYRDFRYVIPFIVQFGLYISPVGFSSTQVPEKWKFFQAINPMAGVIDGFRYALLGESSVTGVEILFSVASITLLIVSGLYYFRITEKTFADII
ncbi:MAG: ABC transporter permease [Verrucomicrobia bacterium]|nr:ABC transporter permease [Verrucomicrobiota bacterium]